MFRIRTRTLAAIAAVSVVATPVAAALAEGEEGSSGEPAAPPSAAVDAQAFVSRATESNAFEIVSSQLAQQRSAKLKIRRIAQRLIRDHTEAQEDLAAAAAPLGLQVPPLVLNPEQTASLSRLASMHGEAFDEAYLATQVVAHEQTIALFVDFASNDGNPQPLRVLAIRTLPGLGEHLSEVRIALRRVRRTPALTGAASSGS